MEQLCRLFGKCRQAWYKATLAKESREMKEVLIVEKVRRIRKELARMGSVKLHKSLRYFFQEHRIKMGRDQFNEVLRKYNLLVPRHKRRARTTNSRHGFRKYKNLTKNLKLERANHLWVSDITYIQVGPYFCYLSLVTDAYSHKIVGWKLLDTLEARGPVEALKMALAQRKDPEKTLIHHSDRGVQYCCHAYIELLDEHKAQISMTQNGDPYENAIAERVNGILKDEILEGRGFINYDLAHEAIQRAIKAYNQLRPHMSVDYLTPNQAHLKKGPLKKHWKNRRRKPDIAQHSHKPVLSEAPPLPCSA